MAAPPNIVKSNAAPVTVTALRTVLLGPSKRAAPNLTKTIAKNIDGSWVEISSHDNAKWYQAQQYNVWNTYDLLELIKTVAAFPNACLIRGRLKAGDTTTQPVRRLLHDQGGDKASFEGMPSAFIPIDVDTLPFPTHFSTETRIEEIVSYVRSKLPPWLRDVSMVWQKTSGWGVKGIRLRLYALADTPVDTDDLKALFADCVGIDHSVFNPVQPIYVAAPIILSGEDFVAERLGISEGHLDRAPLGAALSALRQDRKQVAKTGIGNALPFAPSIGFDGYVAQIGDKPYWPDGNGFNKPINSAIGAAFAKHGSKLDQAALVSVLVNVVKERAKIGGPKNRSQAYFTKILRQLPQNVANIGRKQLKSEQAAAELIYVSDEEAGIVRSTKTADEVAAELPEVFADFYESVEPVAVDRIIRAARKKGVELTGGDFIDTEPATPPQQLARVDLGVGKTEAAIDATIAYVSGERPNLPPRRIGLIVNDHKLAEDVARRFNTKKPGIAAVWYGMDQIDIKSLEGQKMCRRHGDISIWRNAGGSTQDFCSACPFGRSSADQCGYKSQQPNAPVIILVGPSTLMNGLPSVLKRHYRFEREDGEKVDVILPPFDAVLVDETRPTSWVNGTEKPYLISLDDVSGSLKPPNLELTDTANWTTTEWHDIEDRFGKVRGLVERSIKRLQHNKQRPLTFGEVRSVFPTLDGWVRLRRELYRLLMKVDKNLAGFSGEALKNEVRGFASWNNRVRKLIRLCSVAIQSFNVGLPDGSLPDNSKACVRCVAGNGVNVGTGIQLTWREEFEDVWAGVPTLVLDATADVELLRLWWPSLKVVAEGRAKLPESVFVYQVFDTLAGYSGWSPMTVTGPLSVSETKRRTTQLNNVTRVQWLLNVICPMFSKFGGVGFIGPKALVQELDRRYSVSPAGRPVGLVIGHFGAVRGRDDFRDVAVMIDFSRPTPPPIELERITEALFGYQVERLPSGQWFNRGEGFYICAEGGGSVAVKSESHPDPNVARVHNQTVGAELAQADGRSRAVRRDASRPLCQIRATAQPSDRLPVNEFIRMDDVLPFDEIDVAAARGVIVPPGAENRGRFDVFAEILTALNREAGADDPRVTADAARKRLERRQLALSVGQTPKENIYMAFVRLSGLEMNLSDNWSPWRIKLTPTTRYWTEVRLRLPLGATEEEARTVLSSVGISPAFLEPLLEQAVSQASKEAETNDAFVGPNLAAALPEPTIELTDILSATNARLKFRRFIMRPEGRAILKSALSKGLSKDTANLIALTALIGPERVKAAAATAFDGKREQAGLASLNAARKTEPWGNVTGYLPRKSSSLRNS
jgi:hypothetical protein